ncbi:MAG: TatD family hydrolase [Clostridia bacterium]|nr:TatD family hydrolase [Clostridia bacterium]
MIDVHAHMNDARFDEDRAEILREIKEAGIARLINSGCCLMSCKDTLKLAEENDYIYAAIGIHPQEAADLELGGEAAWNELLEMLAHPKVVALGEIGLDYYYENVSRPIQRKWFCAQLELAEKLDLPVVIHSRDAMQDTLEILRAHPNNRGILHCYSGSVESLREILKLGWSISLGGVVTFKNARVAKEVAAEVPLDRLMLETDSPYLAPEPNRGKRNSALNLPYVAKMIAELKGTTPEEIERITDENAMKMFKMA